MADFVAQAAPDPCLRSAERQDSVGKDQYCPVEPGLQIGGEVRIPALLTSDAARVSAYREAVDAIFKGLCFSIQLSARAGDPCVTLFRVGGAHALFRAQGWRDTSATSPRYRNRQINDF